MADATRLTVHNFQQKAFKVDRAEQSDCLVANAWIPVWLTTWENVFQEQYCFLFKCLKVALDDPIIHQYKPPCKAQNKAVELRTLALQVSQKSYQGKK